MLSQILEVLHLRPAQRPSALDWRIDDINDSSILNNDLGLVFSAPASGVNMNRLVLIGVEKDNDSQILI